MKQILIFIALFFSVLYAQAQSVTSNQLNGRLNMTSVSNVSDSTWAITGVFSNSVNKYTPSQIAVNDRFFVQIGANTYVGRISVINSYSNVTRVITFRVICNYPNPPNTSSSIGAIARLTSNGYPVWIDGLPNALQAGIQNYFATLIDSGTTNCEQTLTKNNHGFSPWTPVAYVSGQWIRSTYDSIVPTYVVVDSLSANTFVVSSCGLYDTDLANGIYWYTSAAPGYSLTQDTVKVPLFEVVNGKLNFQPLVGFNLSVAEEGAGTQNTIYTASDSVQITDLQVKLASDGSQTFGIGNWPNFPDRYYNYSSEYGIYVSPNYGGEITVANKRDFMSLYNGVATITSTRNGVENAKIIAAGNESRVTLRANFFAGGYNLDFRLDTTGITIANPFGSYKLIPNYSTSSPSTTASAISQLIWTAGTPTFRQEKNGVISTTTDASGDILVTIPAMPDATYTANIQITGTTLYNTTVHTKTTTSFKVRCFNSAGTVLGAGVTVEFDYDVKDY